MLTPDWSGCCCRGNWCRRYRNGGWKGGSTSAWYSTTAWVCRGRHFNMSSDGITGCITCLKARALNKNVGGRSQCIKVKVVMWLGYVTLLFITSCRCGFIYMYIYIKYWLSAFEAAAQLPLNSLLQSIGQCSLAWSDRLFENGQNQTV